MFISIRFKRDTMHRYFLVKIIEQIEEATVQIDKHTTTGSRLALILIDNAIEVSMWEKINSERSIEDREATLSRTFKDKYKEFKDQTNFLVSKCIITPEAKEILDICHRFRNEAYHQNIVRERIINDLAKIYLEACCKVIFELVLDLPHVNIRRRTTKPEILDKYGIENYPFWLGREKIDEIVSIFLKDRLREPHHFSQTLALDINERINKVRHNIDYIESFDCASTGFTEIEKHALESLSCRVNKLSCAPNVSNALKRYWHIDKELIQIEYRMDFLSDIMS